MVLHKKQGIVKYIKDKVNIENVALYYQFAKSFNLPSFAKETLRCMERCFTMVVETSNFLQLDFYIISRLLSSPKLKIYSELEVFHAADVWLNYNIVERHMFAKDLLLKIRFPLLSYHALKHVLQRSSAFRTNKTSNLMVKEILQDRDNFYQKNKLSVHHMTRYCDHDEFNIIVMGGNLGLEQFVNQIDKRRKVTPLCSFNEYSEYFASVCLNNDIYVFSGTRYNSVKYSVPVKKYSPGFDDKWHKLDDLDSADRDCFSLCAFMNKIYIIGGFIVSSEEITPRCTEFDTKTYEWKEVGEMRGRRAVPASTVFEGRVVTCGGMVENNYLLNTVEAYDHVADQWSSMPSLNEARYSHKMVALRNKLFVFGGRQSRTNEVFDSVCGKFVFITPLKRSLKVDFGMLNDVALVGSRVMIFINTSPFMAVYDTDTNEWSQELCKVTAVNCATYTSEKLPLIFDKI